MASCFLTRPRIQEETTMFDGGSIRAATTGLLADPGQLQESQKELLIIADEEAEHLRELIDDTVAMARLDTERIELHPEMSGILEIVHEVVYSLRTELEGRALDISRDERVPSIAFDRRLVKLAVKQLIDNAAKYSPAGSPVEIQMRHSEDMICLDVTDHGKGIPEQEQKRVFEPFFRSASVRQTIPGSGLGLCIAHSILRAHHGDLTVTSRPGSTTFYMSQPAEYRGEPIERGSNSSN
jgi:signal transduction histidine kinase